MRDEEGGGQGWPTNAAVVHWEGDSREVLSGFPVPVKRKLGEELMRLQIGAKPLDSTPMRTIGSGVFELREADSRGWYRVIYLQRVAGRIFVLHSLIKKSRKTPARDLAIAKERLKIVLRRLSEEKKDGKKK